MREIRNHLPVFHPDRFTRGIVRENGMNRELDLQPDLLRRK